MCDLVLEVEVRHINGDQTARQGCEGGPGMAAWLALSRRCDPYLDPFRLDLGLVGFSL
jgi:hypothetical protein